MLSLQTTAGLVDIPTAVRVAKTIAKSRHSRRLRCRRQCATALEMEARLYRIGIRVHAWSEIHDGLTSGAILDHQCVAIGISNTGRTEETIQMLTVAKAGRLHGGDHGKSRFALARIADDVLIAASPHGYLQPADLSARHCQLFVVDLLYLLIAQLISTARRAFSPRPELRGAAPPAGARRRLVPFLRTPCDARTIQRTE